MSFISIIGKIGKVALGIERAVVPIVETIDPAATPIIAAVDGLVGRIQGSITTAEANNPAEGQGAVKAAAVVADFQDVVGIVQEILAMESKAMTWDASALTAAITAQVAAYNAFSVLKSSIKIVPLSLAVPATGGQQ